MGDAVSEMVERAAKAMEAARFSVRPPFDETPYLEMARAVIAAMREPTQAMLNEGGTAMTASYNESTDVLLTKAWQAMIDEAIR